MAHFILFHSNSKTNAIIILWRIPSLFAMAGPLANSIMPQKALIVEKDD